MAAVSSSSRISAITTIAAGAIDTQGTTRVTANTTATALTASTGIACVGTRPAGNDRREPSAAIATRATNACQPAITAVTSDAISASPTAEARSAAGAVTTMACS